MLTVYSLSMICISTIRVLECTLKVFKSSRVMIAKPNCVTVNASSFDEYWIAAHQISNY
jgi:hypothetical protein